MDRVTVITLTRGRCELLSRAIASVRSQDYLGEIDHLVIVDDCEETLALLTEVASFRPRKLITRFESREPGEIIDGPARRGRVYSRVARLLNDGVRVADSPWIAFLDDDNEYEPNHLSSLVECAARNDSSAVHSFRTIHNADGSPYLEARFPWARNPEESAQIHQLLCSRGVWVRNSNVLKDRAGPKGLTPFQNSTILSPLSPVFMVDTSVWLLKRRLLLKYPIPEKFSAQDLLDNMAPDDKLLELLLTNEIRIVASGLATLRYYLGGISNQS